MANVESTVVDGWTTARLLRWTTDFLTRAGVDSPRLSAELLLAHALGCAKIDLYARFDREPADAQRSVFRDLVRRAAEHEPVAYLVGYKEFYSLHFQVTPDVLIPRPETETLVDRAIAWCRHAQRPDTRVLDLGTGSGCIAIALLAQLRELRVVASDISTAALGLARKNGETHKVLDRLTLVEADRLVLPAECVPPGRFDLIVSNPPYIADSEMHLLDRNVRDYEPPIALSAGPDGLTFYKALHDDGPGVLRCGGSVLVEIGAGMGAAVREVMTAGGVFAHAGTWRDAADPHERVMQFDLRND